MPAWRESPHEAPLRPERELIPYEASVFRADRALVLAAHADDEVLGCGAALADLRERGAGLFVLVLTDGASDEPDEAVRRVTAEERAGESRAALRALGGGELVQGAFRDRELDGKRAEVSLEVRRAVKSLAPDLVFVPSPVEIHPDHRALSEAFLLGAGELPPRTSVAFYELSQPIRPNFLFDATRHAGAKERAMSAFVSQNRQRDYPGFIRGLNAYRRMTLPPAVTSAEAYYVLPAGELAGLPLGRLRARIGPADFEEGP